MLHAKYQPKWTVVLEKKSFKRFLLFLGVAAILNLDS